MIIKEEQIDNLNNPNLSVVPTKTLIRKFGKPEDNVELFVYDLNGNLLLTRENFKGYRPPPNITSKDGLYNEINIDYTQTLKSLGFTSGEYKLVLGFYRKIILNSYTKPFYISEISPSRREIKIKSDLLSDKDVIKGFNELIGVIESSAYFRDFNLNFGSNISSTGINFQIDSISEPTEVLIKLYDPLPNNINKFSKFRITEEIINPISITVDMGESTLDDLIVGEEIKGPNLRIDTRLNSSKPSAFRTYDQILGSSISSSFANINNYLSSSLELAIDFEDVNTDSGYTFENFIHFGSAVERLKNVRYKFQLLESYDDEINDIDTLEGNQTSSVVVVAERDRIAKKKNNLIGNFDAYERFLYYESGTYAWPKTDATKPYILADVDSIQSKTWVGSENYKSNYYGGQLLSGSEYDDINIHRLTDTLPEHIVSNTDNDQYILFVNMVAQHFDNIWIYIDHITNINQAENKLNRGISKDMVFDVLENAGLKVFDQFENSNLFSYIAAESGADGNFQYQAPTSQSMISASSAGSIPKGDITKEVWKRLYHNLPYLLKTKGTERGIKALISCYGIPETILNIKEYGGPSVDATGFRSFSYQKKSNTFRISPSGGISANNYIDITAPNVMGSTKTIQFRFKPDYQSPNQGVQTIMHNSASGMPDHLRVVVSQSIDTSTLYSESFAHVGLVSGSSHKAYSSLIPIYNGDMWNFTVTFDSGSTNTASLFCTNTNRNKSTYVASASLGSHTYFNQVALGNTGMGFGLGTQKAATQFPNGGATEGNYQEIRLSTEKLTKDTIVTQSLSPFNYNGNTISSSYDNLYLRIPLGSNNRDLNKFQFTDNKAPKAGFRNLYSASIKANTTTRTFIGIEETHHLTTPDTVGKAMVSDKVRLDTGTIQDDILSPFVRSEESTQDRQPNDFSDLGVFFSPTFEINEDIIYTLGGFRMDDYIGDPRHYTSNHYPDLKSLREIYIQKIEGKIVNMFDYLKLIQQFDHTLFKMVEQFVPAKTNLKTGLVIEPHYLERNKFKGVSINTDRTSYELNLPGVLPPLSADNTSYESNINVYNYVVTGSGGDTLNNAMYNRTSNKYYSRIRPYNQLTSLQAPPIDPNTGDPIPQPIPDSEIS